MFSDSVRTAKLLEKKNNGELCVQREKKLCEILLRNITTNPHEKFIKFGSIVQLVRRPSKKFLSVTMGFSAHEDFTVSLSSGNYPCMRNTFEIHPVSGHSAKDPLTFNQDFLLQCSNWDKEPLFLVAPPKIWADGGDVQDIKLIKFGQGALNYYRWKFIHPDPEKRIEMEGEPISFNNDVILVHSSTNKVLTNQEIFMRSIFGKEEKIYLEHYNLKSLKNFLWHHSWFLQAPGDP